MVKQVTGVFRIKQSYDPTSRCSATILLTKLTPSKNEVALSYHRLRGLYFLAGVLRRLYYSHFANV